MQLTPAQQAEQAQRTASDPFASAFVSASAGSGKTKLLTDRLLRLMLAGADPARIQCLTFTKAAAAEMSVRLHKRLGEWVRASDQALDRDLASLALAPTDALRQAARTLFARVLDLPGGARIETIHAFCQSLLRRFPLEASLSPYFSVMEESEAALRQSRAREAALVDPEVDATAVTTLSPEVLPNDLARALGALQSHREWLSAALEIGVPALVAAQRRLLGLAPGETSQTILRDALAATDLPALRAVFAELAQARVNLHIERRRPQAQAWLDAAPQAPETFRAWAGYFVKQDGEPFSEKHLIGAELARAQPALKATLLAEQARVLAVLARVCTAHLAALSAALMHLAAPTVAAYEQGKSDAAALDYADLIGRTRDLLREPGAAWVLFKLDGGLDHLLLDEVQDTAPEQWEIAGAITAEFFAGLGAREVVVPRSVFAVGDPKQSIYSFQGADPQGFVTWRQRMGTRARQAEGSFLDVPLEVSFRSTVPVLALTDAVFADAAADMGLPPGEMVRHVAHRAGHAGMVELWPKVPRPPKLDAPRWAAPAETPPEPAAQARLAEAVADWIAGHTDGSDTLRSEDRPLRPGDILVLVRSRGLFEQSLLGALKRRFVPVAGLDRMKLAEQPAIADLLALCDVLLLPGDDLQLATVLTSPLGGLTDDGLMTLALERRGTLWDALLARAAERPDWQQAASLLQALLARVDYVTPHALLAEILGARGGRARLLARLGPEASEAIDELLSQALAYAARHPPSLQGFVHWLRQSGSEVKRQAESLSDRVRIMTVHGAKGLEAPVVILPASFGLSGTSPTLAWGRDEETGRRIPLWGPRKETQDAVLRQHLGALRDDERREHYRLLYVALTRARDRLVVCGWESGKKMADEWYAAIEAGFRRLPEVRSEPFAAVAAAWQGERLCWQTVQTEPAAVARTPMPQGEAADLPAWVGARTGWQAAALPAEPALPASFAPSRPDDAALGPVPSAASPIAERSRTRRRFHRGKLIHSLLQHLPAVPEAERRQAARDWLARPANRLTPGEAAGLAQEALDLLADPALAPLFGPGSRAEVPLTGVIETPSGPIAVGGLVDRLAVLPDRVMIADYKTNREPPPSVETIPALYLRQMAAYREVIQRIFPGRRADCVLIWTRNGQSSWLPEALLDRHRPAGSLPA